MNKKEREGFGERGLRRVQLMVDVQRGDRESCRLLFDDIGHPLMNFLRRRMSDSSELEDVYQDTLLAIYQARHTFDAARPFEPWFFAIARNVASDHSRRHWTRASWIDLVESLPEHPAEVESREPDFDHLLSGLPQGQREAFEMLKLEGLSVKQAAARAGTSVSAIKVRAHRAYRTLKDLLAR